MSLKPVAVEGMVLKIVEGAPTAVQGVVQIIGISALKCSAEGKGIYQADLTISVSNITSPDGNATTPDPTPRVSAIRSTATYTEVEGKLVLRKGDKSDIINAQPIIPPPPPSGTPYPVTFRVEIDDPGQTKVEAE